jgi:hypothetical protein
MCISTDKLGYDSPGKRSRGDGVRARPRFERFGAGAGPRSSPTPRITRLTVRLRLLLRADLDLAISKLALGAGLALASARLRTSVAAARPFELVRVRVACEQGGRDKGAVGHCQVTSLAAPALYLLLEF